jgi:RecA-family ATPase
VFGGDENSRTQVRQFITLLRGLAIKHDTTVLLLAHPSVAGMASNRGTSGSTAWSNSVRSRLYFDRVLDDGQELDPDVRVLSTKKANYARNGAATRVRWRAGVFTVTVNDDDEKSSIVIAKEAKADSIFLELVAAYEMQARPVSVKPSANFAPHVFASDARTNGISKAELVASMNRLLDADCIRVEEFGPPTRRRNKLVVAP